MSFPRSTSSRIVWLTLVCVVAGGVVASSYRTPTVEIEPDSAPLQTEELGLPRGPEKLEVQVNRLPLEKEVPVILGTTVVGTEVGASGASNLDVVGGIGGLIESGTVAGHGEASFGAKGEGQGAGGWAVGSGGLGARGMGGGSGGHRRFPDSVPVVAGAPMTGDQYNPISESGMMVVADSPLSTFSIDVDTASYANVRRYLNEGTLPPRDAVRVEELMNYFTYDYPEPTNDQPFAVHPEVTSAPWAEGHRLVRIGIQGKHLAATEMPPRNLVFLVDVSGSMAGPDRLVLIQRGLTLLASQLDEDDHVAIVAYAGAAGVVLQPTRGNRHAEIDSAIERLQSGGSTAGGAGIRAAYDLAERHFERGAVNRVILATDGDFNVGVSSEAELVQLIEEKRKTGVFLSVLGVGRGNLHDDRMEQLADKGNGNYAIIDSMAEMKKVLLEQASATLVTIAKDVKIQVEFNPAEVSAWRLLGYENRALAARDFNDDTKDAGEIGAGHSVTALYEVIPASIGVAAEVDPLRYQEGLMQSGAASSGELLTVAVRFKAPDSDSSRLISMAVRDAGGLFTAASQDLQFAASVAGFGMMLRDSDRRGTMDWGWVAGTARDALGKDPAGYRTEFLGLVGLATRLTVGG